MPTFKTCYYNEYIAGLDYLLDNLRFLLQFERENAFRKWRFFRYRMKEKALDTLAKRVVPIASPDVLVGYGDWSCRPNIRGHAPVPVKGFRNALKKRARLVSIDEFRTSKLCSSCRQPLDLAAYPHQDENGRFDMKETRNVLHCATSDCNATFWDRDVNAAINMLRLLQNEVAGHPRPPQFTRTG